MEENKSMRVLHAALNVHSYKIGILLWENALCTMVGTVTIFNKDKFAKCKYDAEITCVLKLIL